MNKIRKIKGIDSLYGNNLNKMEFIIFKMYEAVSKVGYKELQVPILEPAESYSEKVIGKSPWPEWNEKGCFYMDIADYSSDYNKNPIITKNILIPEGTVSVTRWLGEQLDENSDIVLPLKIFYNLTCFRNELVDSLNENKKREFKQFGIEVLGTSNILADLENLYMATYLLEEVGIDREEIRSRVNHIQIFSNLCKESNFSAQERVLLKEQLDTIAECKAGKNPERYDDAISNISRLLLSKDLSSRINKCWDMIIQFPLGRIDESYYHVFGDNYKVYFDELNYIYDIFKNENINILIDLCVIRSHEYYTGFSFEIDVITRKYNFYEIAGGGRYDKLVKNFVMNSKIELVPCTGFAFGMNRVKKMMDELLLYPLCENVNINFIFDEKNKPILIPVKEPKNYISKFESLLSNNTRFSIYLGDSLDNIDKYAKVNDFELEDSKK